MKTYHPKVVYVDTNVLLRFLLRDNSTQLKAAESLFKKAKEGKIKLVVAQVVIFEINFVLKRVYSLPKEDIIPQFESLFSTPYFIIQDNETFNQALKLYKNSNNSLADCFLLTETKIEEAELFTFDKKLQKLT